ncbi:MAG: group III truncated hemoglobin [Sphingobacteriaceae bacterium]|nr:group III truncated hemoglobin [Sphingobacteriaceae bacterium]
MKDLISREDIELLVNAFYQKVQKDDVIGFIFNDVAKVNWEQHLPKMYDFWETILFGQKGFKGNPMEVHFKLNQKQALGDREFERWKALFNTTVDENFEGEFAELAKQKAQSIADLMLFKINTSGKSIIEVKNNTQTNL